MYMYVPKMQMLPGIQLAYIVPCPHSSVHVHVVRPLFLNPFYTSNLCM